MGKALIISLNNVTFLFRHATNKHYLFKSFIGGNWWFFLIGFTNTLRQSEKESASGSVALDVLFGGGIIMIILFTYWFIGYGRKQRET
jgi:hypothetical protein